MNWNRRIILKGKLIIALMIFSTNPADAQDSVKTGFLQKSSTMDERWELGA